MDRFKEYTRQLEHALARQDFDHDPSELYQPMHYIMHLGGKRLRPALTLAGSDLFEGELSEALLPALGIETFHNFSLVHDDIMDQAELRRGKPTVHKKWDRNRAILAGDALLVKSYQYLAQVERATLPKVLKVFSRTAMEVCEGQQMDMNFERHPATTETAYLEMIRLKTAVLIGAALQIGALIAKAKKDQAAQLYRFGEQAGLAFQVQDDLLDSFGDPEKFGKRVGGDILQGKNTLLMIYAREADPEGLKKMPGQKASEEERIKAYQNWFVKTGARSQAVAKREQLLQNALEALEAAQAKKAAVKEDLAQFAQWLAHRDH